MSTVKRLISAVGSETSKFTAMELKESIYRSEGRVVMGQHLLFTGNGLVHGCTNTELMFAWGADMVLLNTMNFDNNDLNPGLQGLTIKELKTLCKKPIGVYLGCPKNNDTSDSQYYFLDGMLATEEHIKKAVEYGFDFIILGGNPGSGTSISDIVKTTKLAKKIVGNDILLFAGKWEDGVDEKVLGDPTADYDHKEVIKQLIDAGADCIDFPAPGSRHGITVDDIKKLVEFTHTYKKGTLALSFLNSSVEGSDAETIRLITLLMKQTGVDIHAIGDGGFGGCSTPENMYQMSISLKGKSYTYFKMATTNR